MKFKNFFILALLLLGISKSAEARQSFEFNLGDQIHVLSDKAYRKTRTNQFEAVGNVVITHLSKAIYGEKASLSFNTGEVKVIGNVRYVGPTMTMYGTELFFNFKTNFLSIKNARIISDNYTVLGKTISRINQNTLIAEDAEYTTCKDCPESWSIFGKRVHITLGQYVRIKHAFIKVRGVILMYVPYIILPIKKNRETGLLFPKFGISLEEGARFQQPWFWAISDYNDLTLTPSIFGKRGWGNELQYRQNIGDKKWFEFNSIQVIDRIYQPDKRNLDISGKHFIRHFSDYEHHFSFGNNFTHHFKYYDARDLDVVRDYDFYTDSKLEGSELGGGGFLGYRNSLLNFNVESYYNKNLIVDNSKEFDQSYVQILPKLSLSIVPIPILNTSIFPFTHFSMGFDSDVTVFKQNHYEKINFIRNATRTNLNPYLNWNLGNIGPVGIKTKMSLDYQQYRFSQEDAKTFSKRGFVYETEFKTEIQKVFGLAYEEEIPASKVNLKELEEKQNKGKEKETEKEKQKKKDEGLLIGELPGYHPELQSKVYKVRRSSYRHSQEYKLKHYFISDQRTRGNKNFRDQIANEEGLFDQLDSLRDREHTLTNALSKTGIPLRNTIEAQWNNTLLRKSPKSFDAYEDDRFLRQNFEYKKVAYFNVSQGYDLDVESDKTVDSLTRLLLAGGVEFKELSLSFTENYFYKEQGHVASFSINKSFTGGGLGGSISYDSFSTPVNKQLNFHANYKPIDLISLLVDYDYDWENKKSSGSTYGVVYSPLNNCWKLDVKYKTTQIDKRYSVNFLINFNENSFKSLSGN